MEQFHGKIFLPDYMRDDFPWPFVHYAPLVRQAMAAVAANKETVLKEPTFLNYPIPDLSVPSAQPLQDLLLQLLQALEEDQHHVIYLHCWGGRGRAGLVGACLVSLLYPELDAETVLDWIQRGYDSRAGADQMPRALQKSPQTDKQRQFVAQFVRERQRQQI